MISAMSSFVTWGQSIWAREPRRRRGAGHRLRGRKRAGRSAFEVLEGRITPTTFLVVNALDGPGSGPSGSLRNAITLAEQSGDTAATVVISPKVKGTIALDAGELTIGASLTILNRSGGPIEIRQTTPGDRVLDVTSNTLAARVNLAGASRHQTLTIAGGSIATGNGGGILVENPANVLTLTNVRIVGNSAGLASSSDVTQNGGGIYSGGRVVLVRSTVGTVAAPNQTSGDGGGIWAGAGVSMTASTVVGNRAGNDGGGLFVSAGNTTVSRSRVDGNRALNVGGINEVKGDVRVVDGSEVNGNSSTALLDESAGNFGGGGISEGVGDVFVSRSQVSHNHSVGMYSSGIVVALGSVTVTVGEPGQLEQQQRAGRRHRGEFRRDRDRERPQPGRPQHGLGQRRGDRQLRGPDGRRPHPRRQRGQPQHPHELRVARPGGRRLPRSARGLAGPRLHHRDRRHERRRD